jgi:hypothetical protein
MKENECDLANFIEVTLTTPNDFLKICETLTRIGVTAKNEKTLYQSCHLLHKKGKYYLVHFKELFMLDGLTSDISETDVGRRNVIAELLEEWNLLTIVNYDLVENGPEISLGQLKIIPFKEKHEWKLVPKYHIGKKNK